MIDLASLAGTGPNDWYPNEHDGRPLLYEAILVVPDETQTLHGQCSMALPFELTLVRYLGDDEDRSCDLCGELIANTDPDVYAGRVSVLD